MPGRDTTTRFQGVFARHRKACAADTGGECDCAPSFYGKVYDRSTRRYLSTKRFKSVTAAKNARKDLVGRLESGDLPREQPLRFKDAHDRFVEAAREGRALNKHGRRYKATAIRDIDECLRVHVNPRIGTKRLTDVRRADIQSLVDDLTPSKSGSRVRSVVNAVRSLYRWAQDRELANHDPAALVRLPAMNATPRDRVADPDEFARLLAALTLEDALPYALAGYAMGRSAQILRVRWREVDLDIGAVEWGAEEDARKSRAARRVVPAVRPLRTMLKRAWLEQGRPAGDVLVCPPRKYTKTGLMSPVALATRAKAAWRTAGLNPIGLHECRHTAATWMDAAGVSPKVASVLMGHATPDAQAGAAPITLGRYTHTLPGDLERARDLLDSFLADRTRKATG